MDFHASSETRLSKRHVHTQEAVRHKAQVALLDQSPGAQTPLSTMCAFRIIIAFSPWHVGFERRRQVTSIILHLCMLC